MKVIFIKNLKNQGKIDEIKEVSDGYATNFLIKNGYAVKYTKGSQERLEDDIKNRALEEEKNIKQAKELKTKLEKENLIYISKSGVDGRIFGNISTKQINEKLITLGYTIDKKKIKIDTPLNLLGTHYVNIELHKTVLAKLKVTIKEK